MVVLSTQYEGCYFPIEIIKTTTDVVPYVIFKCNAGFDSRPWTEHTDV